MFSRLDYTAVVQHMYSAVHEKYSPSSTETWPAERMRELVRCYQRHGWCLLDTCICGGIV